MTHSGYVLALWPQESGKYNSLGPFSKLSTVREHNGGMQVLFSEIIRASPVFKVWS